MYLELAVKVMWKWSCEEARCNDAKPVCSKIACARPANFTPRNRNKLPSSGLLSPTARRCIERPTMLSSDPSVPPNGRCVFFTPPRELRDLIYEYALTEEKGLIGELPDNSSTNPRLYATRDPHTNLPDREANQLKYVCLQLHNETTGLAAKLNDLELLFHYTTERTGSQVFEAFVQNCSISYEKNIRKVVIIHAQDSDDIRRRIGHDTTILLCRLLSGIDSPLLYEFCKRNPKARVVVRYDAFRAHNDDMEVCDRWIWQHAVMSRILRGKSEYTFGMFPCANQIKHELKFDRYIEEGPQRLFEMRALGLIPRPLANLRLTLSVTLDYDKIGTAVKYRISKHRDHEQAAGDAIRLFEDGC
ncbi:hypothetical protein BDV95DRAFT_589015 [Massariosphaeria phaeospora]|uniref:Uncharacterized protein n=1 Tax=Massariosphaeria phaeospora TaxID=100035 RepID=A0A7C8IJG3_9PLEO|nr:hypothetical protein BDV95DRAFT_589015 [Massariosphaeria phaeospora]